MLNPPAIAPRGECRSNNDVFRGLAARLGFEPELFPDDETLIREVLDGGPTLDGDHPRTASGRRVGPARTCPSRTPRSPTGVFPTPSGKCELYSERMQGDGLDPLPTYIPPREDPQTRPDLAARYPAPAAQPASAAVPQLDLRQPGPSPHRPPATRRSSSPPRTPTSRGLVDGQWAEVYNDRGRFQARVALTGAVRPGVAVATGIYWSKLSPGRSQRQQHHLLGPDRHGRRGDLLR